MSIVRQSGQSYGTNSIDQTTAAAKAAMTEISVVYAYGVRQANATVAQAATQIKQAVASGRITPAEERRLHQRTKAYLAEMNTIAISASQHITQITGGLSLTSPDIG